MYCSRKKVKATKSKEERTMALSITKISKWLKKNKLAVIKHELDKAENTITFLTSDSEGTEAHIIRIRENGELFEWRMHLILEKEGETQRFLFPSDHPHIAKVFKYALVLNDERKFGRWMYDETTEEMVFSVNIPFENAEMTKKQFLRFMGLMFHNAREESQALRTVLEDGEIPENEHKTLFKMLAKYMQQHQDEVIDTTVEL